MSTSGPLHGDPLEVEAAAGALHTEPHYVRPRVPRRAIVRFLLLVAMVGGALLLLRFTPLAEQIQPARLLAAVRAFREVWWAPLALIGLFALAAPFGAPVSPLVFTGGAVFGTLLGSVYNAAGLVIGSIIAYLVAKALGRELVEHLFGQRLKRIEKRLARGGFWPLVQIRLLPVPFAIVNMGAAVTGVRFPLFVASAITGVFPSTFIYTYFASAIASSVGADHEGIFLRVGLALGLLFGLTLLPSALRGRLRRRRLEALRNHRQARSSR